MNFFNHRQRDQDFKVKNVINLLMKTEESALATAKEDYKIGKVIAIVGTVLVSGICLGIMYVRFRVLGG